MFKENVPSCCLVRCLCGYTPAQHWDSCSDSQQQHRKSGNRSRRSPSQQSPKEIVKAVRPVTALPHMQAEVSHDRVTVGSYLQPADVDHSA